MAASVTGRAINRDWEERDFVESMQMNILKMTEFLNRFDTSTRFRLAKLNEKLSRLERSLDYVEAAIKPREEGGGGGGA